MYVLLIIVIFGFYYLLYYTAVLWSERLVLKSTLIYIVSGILFSIPFIFMPNNQKSVDTYVVILFLGVVFYGFAAINALWKRPLKIKFEVSTKYSNQSISQWKYGQIESMKINLQLSKYRLYISLGVLAALFIAAKILVTPDMVDVIVEIVETFFIILFFVTIVFFVIDIVLWIKRGKFAFITIKPLFIMALIILLVWFLP